MFQAIVNYRQAGQRPVHFPFSHELNVGQRSMSQVSTRVASGARPKAKSLGIGTWVRRYVNTVDKNTGRCEW